MLSWFRGFFDPNVVVPIAIIVAVAAMVAVANWRDGQRSRQPYTTAAPFGAAGAIQTSREALDRRVHEMDARLQAQPDDRGAALLLADALLRQTRVTGNPGLALRAEQALKRVLVDDPGGYDANRMLGALYLSQHRFREAIRVAEQNRAARPADPVNYGVIGDAHVELGDYDEAFGAFDQMMKRRPSAASYARVAYARELQGNLAGAVAAMTLAADATSPTDLEALAWTRAQLGDLYLQLGKLHEAKSAYAAASQAFPGHPFAVGGYAKAIAVEGDVNGALELLRGLSEQSPTPDLAARIGELLERLGRHADAERQYALAEAGWRGDAPEPKNLARFLAEHDRKIPEAVAIAETAAAARRDIFTEDALAWAYFKAGRHADARRAIALALRTGTQDATIRSHAAAIERATIADVGEDQRVRPGPTHRSATTGGG